MNLIDMNYKRTSLKAKSITAASLLLILATGIGRATVSMRLTDNTGDPTQTTALAGALFTVSVSLEATVEQTTGITYFLQESAPGNPHFQLTARDTTNTTYSVLTETDPQVLFSTPNALLDPATNVDLGGGVANVNAPNGPGSWFVANLTLRVLPETPAGTYMLGFSPSTVASGPGPEFAEIPVSSIQYAVFVPEPSSALFLGIGGLAFAAFSRRRPSV